MAEPMISYGEGEGQPLTQSAQYLLARAGLSGGAYTNEYFIASLKAVRINELPVSFDRCGELHGRLLELVTATAMQKGSTVIIENFAPDMRSLEAIMSRPFE